VGLPSLSALRNKSFSNPKAILMSQNAAPRAARQGSLSGVVAAITAVPVATGPGARCFLRNVPIVAKIPKYLLNHVVISRFTVVIATEKTDRPGKLV